MTGDLIEYFITSTESHLFQCMVSDNVRGRAEYRKPSSNTGIVTDVLLSHNILNVSYISNFGYHTAKTYRKSLSYT